MKNNTLSLIILNNEGESEKELKICILFLVTGLLFRIVLTEKKTGGDYTRYMLKNLCFTFDKTHVEQFQGLLENKEGNKNKEGKKVKDRTKKQSKRTGKKRN
jgi:hypothetical protein